MNGQIAEAIGAPQPSAGERRAAGLDLTFARWLAYRLAFSVVVIIFLSMLVFAATNLLPGTAVDTLLGQSATPATRAALTERLGLDKPVPVRYWDWARGAIRLDFGRSMVTNEAVGPLVADRAKNSAVLAAFAVVLVVLGSIFLGTLSAFRRGRRIDRLITGATFVGISLPEFVLGIILAWALGVKLGLLPVLSLNVQSPTSAGQWLKQFILPVIAATPITGSYMIRTMRHSVVQVLDQEFITMAPLRGLSRRRVVLRHVLPNALVPMVNVFILHVGELFAGVVVVEAVFQFPGIGRMLFDGVGMRDIPVVQAVALLMGVVFVLVTLASDLALALLDPRVGARTA